MSAPTSQPHTRQLPQEMAKAFHDLYEELAPQFGYETRPDTREFDPESPNGRLMIEVCRRLAATQVGEGPE